MMNSLLPIQLDDDWLPNVEAALMMRCVSTLAPRYEASDYRTRVQLEDQALRVAGALTGQVLLQLVPLRVG